MYNKYSRLTEIHRQHATYQRAIQACFKMQLNKNVEAYVDDVVVKTINSSTLIDDLEETFASLRE
jgi:hypothetical protein